MNPSERDGPRLPGIVPRGGDKPGETAEPVNPLVKLAVQFFVIPMAIVVFCIALVFIFRLLTYEKQDMEAYLSALSSVTRSSSQKEQDAMKMLNYIQESKSWQSIYDVTEQLRFNRQKFLATNPDFPDKVAQIFQRASGSDQRIRQYLAQVLGLVGGPKAVSALVASLKEDDSETAIHSMVALGKIGDLKALPALLEVSHSGDRGLRQTAVFVLGNFHDKAALERCAEAMHDPDLLVTWNAAFALARQSDSRAVPVLREFLEQGYVERVTKEYAPTTGVTQETGVGKVVLATFHPERLLEYRCSAVRLLGQFSDPMIKKELQRVAESDKQLRVRQAAIEAMGRDPAPIR